MSSRTKRLNIIRPAGPTSEINITPLVDVVLVLLIIFMVVTPLLEKDITVRVPATEVAEKRDEVPPDQLVVRIDKDGELTINDNKTPDLELVDRLRVVLAKKPASDKLVFIVADDSVNYARLVSVLDRAKQAGADTIGMATELPPDQQGAPGASGQPAAPPAPAPAPEQK
jgi:biopolymer transport protein TolR